MSRTIARIKIAIHSAACILYGLVQIAHFLGHLRNRPFGRFFRRARRLAIVIRTQGFGGESACIPGVRPICVIGRAGVIVDGRGQHRSLDNAVGFIAHAA